jgi:hypothetical protein
MRLARLAAPLAAVVSAMLAGSVALPATAGAAAATATSPGGTEHVLLTLTPQNRGALHALARTTGHGHRARPVALAHALPSVAQRRSVAATAAALGLHVDHVGTMSMLVSGPAARVDGLFGSARSIDPRSRMQHPLPMLPAAFRGEVTAAFGGDDDRAAFRHFTLPNHTVDPTELRTAYGNSSTDPLTLPSDPAAAAATQQESIATVQLSGWYSSDLTDYAAYLTQQTGDLWPTPKYTAIDDPLLPSKVAQKPSSPNYGNDLEVALDQEALYAVAPYAHQRAYLSGNDLIGMYDSLGAIGDDATDPTVDHHLVAASVSWGFCETDIANDPSAGRLYQAFQDVLSYVLASGVTVFAASGDNGTRCDYDPATGTGHVGVSYPASSNLVVAVGGTQVPDDGSSLADPTSQEAWSDQYGTTGGGVSQRFSRPAFQDAAGTGSARRAVPDISALAGNPGFEVVSSGPTGGGPVGGTSLASPVAAAGFAVEVAAHGYSWGVGDILPGLYAQPAAFTDVAAPGYDEQTGLGTPNWSALVSPALGGDPHLSVGAAYNPSPTVPITVRVPDWQAYDSYRVDVDVDHSNDTSCQLDNRDTASPPTSVHVPGLGYPGSADGVHQLTLVAIESPAAATGSYVCHYADAFVLVDTTAPEPAPKLAVGGHRRLVASWGGGDFGGSGITHYHVTLEANGHTVLSFTADGRGSRSVHTRPGRVYTLSAQLVDDRQFRRSAAWTDVARYAAYDGTLSSAERHGKARVWVRGRIFRLVVDTCPSCGKLGVYVGGHLRKTVDTYSRHTRHRVTVAVYALAHNHARTLVLKPLTKKNRHSSGYTVGVDAVTTTG